MPCNIVNIKSFPEQHVSTPFNNTLDMKDHEVKLTHQHSWTARVVEKTDQLQNSQLFPYFGRWLPCKTKLKRTLQ